MSPQTEAAGQLTLFPRTPEEMDAYLTKEVAKVLATINNGCCESCTCSALATELKLNVRHD